MTESNGKFSFLNRKDMIKFLQVTFREFRKLTMQEGFSGVRAAISKTLVELKKVEEKPPEKRP